jgi:Spy/CpxP family protein refolding chaperone
MVGFLAASAYAWGCGGMNGSGYNNGMHGRGNYNGAGYNNDGDQSFNNDTQALRSSIAADRTELNALMAGTNPDPKQARELSERISKSENELRNKAQEYNVSSRGMMGYGQGAYRGMSGFNGNYMGCW